MQQYSEVADRVAITHIAKEIRKEWGTKISVHARPYLEAMVYDSYGHDGYINVTLRFLANASTYRGEMARKHKSALKAIITGR